MEDEITEFHAPPRIDNSIVDVLEKETVTEEGEHNEDIIVLNTTYLNEKHAPKLLPYNEELVNDVLEQIENQQSFIDEQYAMVENRTNQVVFSTKLYQMEIDRIKYLVASYLRMRLQKLEEHALYYMKNSQFKKCMSDGEWKYLCGYVDLVENHFSNVVLQKLPEEYAAMDAENMIDVPDADKFVFCKSLQDIGLVQCDNRGQEQVSMQQHDQHVLRYRIIEELLFENQLKLI